MNLTDVVGSKRNAIEVVGIIDIIDAIDWSAVPTEHWSRGLKQVRDLSPGRGAATGDYVFFDQCKCNCISVAEAADLCRLLQSMLDGHPTGKVLTKDEHDIVEADDPRKDNGAFEDEIDITGDVGASQIVVIARLAELTAQLAIPKPSGGLRPSVPLPVRMCGLP